MPDREPSLPLEMCPPAMPRFRLSGLARGLFLYTGVVLPVLCFLFGYPDKPDWQSGAASAFAQLYLSPRGSLPFYPLLFYNITCMGLLVYHPQRFVGNAFVRFGVYSGVVVAIGFFGLFCVCTDPSGNKKFLEIYFFWAGLCTIIPGLLFYFSAKYIWIQRVAYFLILICVMFFPASIAISFFLSTPWAVASYATMSFLLIRHRKEKGFQFTLAQLMGVVTWFGGYCAAWRVAYLIVLEEYAKLPAKAPQRCYLCTAAARGHRRWVRSEEFIAADGGKCRVNDQLRCFKAFELLLLAGSPRLHRLCRRVYDAVGPAMARAIMYPLFADIAYAALKPLEWFCRAMLFTVVRDRAGWLRLYRGCLGGNDEDRR